MCTDISNPGGLNLEKTGMYHRRLKLSALFWSGKAQKVYPVLEPRNYVSYLITVLSRPAPYRIVLYCTVLYCTVLYCTVLYCTVLYCTVLYCTVLYCTVLYCTLLYSTLLYSIVFYCTVLYCTELCCIVLYCIVLYWRQRPCLCFTYLIK